MPLPPHGSTAGRSRAPLSKSWCFSAWQKLVLLSLATCRRGENMGKRARSDAFRLNAESPDAREALRTAAVAIIEASGGPRSAVQDLICVAITLSSYPALNAENILAFAADWQRPFVPEHEDNEAAEDDATATSGIPAPPSPRPRGRDGAGGGGGDEAAQLVAGLDDASHPLDGLGEGPTARTGLSRNYRMIARLWERLDIITCEAIDKAEEWETQCPPRWVIGRDTVDQIVIDSTALTDMFSDILERERTGIGHAVTDGERAMAFKQCDLLAHRIRVVLRAME